MNVSRSVRRIVATAVMTLLVAPLAGAITLRAGSADDSGAALRVIGSVPEPIGPLRGNQGQEIIVGSDRARRLMFMVYTDVEARVHLVTYDMKPRIPKQLGLGDLGTNNEWSTPVSPYQVAYDSKRRQLAFVAPWTDVAGSAVPSHVPSIVVYDTVKNAVVKKQPIAAIAPGFLPLGITYSDKDDQYYAIGEFSGSDVSLASGAFGKFASPGNGVIAITPDIGLKWARTVVNCPQFLLSWGIGSFVARSSDRPALYIPCVGGGTAFGGTTNPIESGLVRLPIVPDGTSADQALTTEEFFSISGNYYSGGSSTGVAAFDPVTERFYLSSLSYTTPGTWVFDGRLDAWVGFVSATNSHNKFIGLNEGNGHLYLGMQGRGGDDGPDGLLVADVRQTPVPAGDLVPIVPTYLVATDPGSNRLYVRPADLNAPYQVVEDNKDVTHGGLGDVDYDAGTAGLPDVPQNDVDFTAGATGYGAQVVQVGGGSAPRSALGSTGEGSSVPKEAKKLDNTRAAMTGRVGYLDLRRDSASVSAQALAVDEATQTSYETDDNDGDGKPDGGPWPYPIAQCNNEIGSKPSSVTTHGNDRAEKVPDDDAATAHCDPSKGTAQASAVISGASSNGVTIAHSTYTANAVRNTKDGVLLTTEAEATGVTYALPLGYRLQLGRVYARTETIAHGRSGTARSEWWRSVDGIRIIDATGKPTAIGGCASHVKSVGTKPEQTDSCAQISEAVDKVLPMRFQLTFPMPLVEATPKGAFSGVEQTLGQFAQQNVINDQGVVYHGDSVGIRPAPAVVSELYEDTAERSRTVTYLAATQANVTFTTNPPITGGDYTPPPVPQQTTVAQPKVVETLTAPSAAPTTPVVAQPQGPRGGGTSVLQQLAGYLFTRRGARDIALLLLFSGLVLGGGGTAWRRRRLVDVLVTVPGKEAL